MDIINSQPNITKVIILVLLPAVVLAVGFNHYDVGTTNISTVVITPRASVHLAKFEGNNLGISDIRVLFLSV